MKVITVLLAASLLVNAVLLLRPKPAAFVPADSTTHASTVETESVAARSPSSETVARFFDFNTRSPASLKNALEAAGFPPDEVRAIVVAAIAAHFDPRKRALLREGNLYEYWQTGNHAYGFTVGDAAFESTYRAIRREEISLLRTAYPDALPYEPTFAASKAQFGIDDEDKIRALNRINMDYVVLRQEMLERSPDGRASQEDEQKIRLLEQERQADIAALLTPEELFEYELRSSPTARQLRYTLAVFGPTEEEFRRIFPIQKTIDATRNPGSPANNTITLGLDFRVDHSEFVRQLEGVLSPERHSDLAFVIDRDNYSIARVTQRLGLPLSVAREVAKLRDSTNNAVASVGRDDTLDAGAKRERAAEIARETMTQVNEMLGPNGTNAYLQSGGSWLRSLQRSLASRPASTTP